jgi:hypothetical protein
VRLFLFKPSRLSWVGVQDLGVKVNLFQAKKVEILLKKSQTQPCVDRRSEPLPASAVDGRGGGGRGSADHPRPGVRWSGGRHTSQPALFCQGCQILQKNLTSPPPLPRYRNVTTVVQELYIFISHPVKDPNTGRFFRIRVRIQRNLDTVPVRNLTVLQHRGSYG